MSDQTQPLDRILLHLRERLATLDTEISERQAHRADLLSLVAELSDGRSRVSKGVKRTGTTTNSTATDAAAADVAQQEAGA